MAEYIYDTIIVGGGIAGLTAATYTSRAGKKTLLIEKNKECGGLVNTFSHEGFTFDAGVRALEDAGIIFPMLQDLNIEMEFVKSHVSVGVENEILNIENIDSLEEYQNLLIKLFPESKSEIHDVIKIIKKIMKHMEVLYGLENPVFKDLKKDYKFIFKQLLPWLPKFIFTVGKINKMNIPIEEYLETIISNPSLRDVIAQHFFKNTPSFFALSYFSLYLDYFYPKGGVGKLSEALEKKINEFNGEIKTETIITNVDAGECKVFDDQGNSYCYKKLIWAADLKTLYKNCSTKNLSPKIVEEFEKSKSKMLKNRGCDSVFSIYLKIDEPLETFGKIAHGHFFYTPLKQGLGQTHRKELDELLDKFDELQKEDVFEWLDRFIKLNTFEISIPALKDKSMVPEGKTGMIISCLAEYDLFKKAEKAGWLKELVAGFEERMIDAINSSVYPMLKDKIMSKFSFSPLSIENRVGSSEGAIVGWEFVKNMPVVNKIQFTDRSVTTPLPNVYQAGQWSYSPAGVPIAILTGKLASDRITRKK